MIRRLTSWLLLAVAAVVTLLAAYFLRPADVFELLVGLFAGGVSRFQWSLLMGAAVLIAAALTVDRLPTRTKRWTTILLAVLVVIVGASKVIRDRGNYVRETITLRADSVQLEGTAYRPRDDGTWRHPAILILHGSGPVAREGYHTFARRFAERGFVVLNMDKQGVGGSSGKYFGDDLGRGVIDIRAREARVALQYLAARQDVDTARVGVFSMSQGGWVVPLLLDGTTPARFGVVFSGVAVSSGEEGVWSEWTNDDADQFSFNPPPVPFEELDQRIRSQAPSAFDPRPALARMTMPTIWMFGEWDASAPTAASVRVLDSLKTMRVPVSYLVYPHANHGLMIVRGPGGKRNANFVEGLWPGVFEWFERLRITPQSQKPN